MSEQSERITHDSGGWAIARWSGEIDMTNAGAHAREALGGVDNRHLGLVVDLSQVSYLDSAGIGSLVLLCRQLHERHLGFTLVVPERSVLRSSLDVGGIPVLIPTYPTMAAARAGR